MKKILSIVVILLALTATQAASAQSFKVIVNEANSTESVSSNELSDIFLKKTKKWADGKDINPVDLNTRSEVREEFSQQIHGRGIGAIRNFWQQAAFSGAGSAPLERSSDADVIEYVKANPGAVGYISASADASGVKVLSVK